jgi:hypothetical protein
MEADPLEQARLLTILRFYRGWLKWDRQDGMYVGATAPSAIAD